jgi:hypothetical protein
VTLLGGIPFSNVGPRAYLVLDGFIVDALGANEVLWIGNDSHHIKLSNNEAKNARHHGIAASGVGNWITHNRIHHGGYVPIYPGYPLDFGNAMYISGYEELVEHNEIYDWAGAGIQVFTGSATARNDNTVVRYNWIHDTSGSQAALGDGRGVAQGIILYNGANLQAYGNVLSNLQGDPGYVGNQPAGIDLQDCAACKVFNNTIYRSPVVALHLSDGSVVGAEVRNNLVWLNATDDLYDRGTATSASNNLIGDPGFVNAAANDYHLGAGSPAIDQGTRLSAPWNVDKDGVLRPQGAAFDIGAYEWRPGP